ncbi:MAG: glycosyltransferase family 39 protein, partial [Candidatus Eremiobacterota bacterium]
MNIRERIKQKKYDIIICILLIIISSAVRIILIDKLPMGLHGDEGWTGIDARKIIKNGYIPVYVDSAAGQPAGPLYLTALFFKLFGTSIFTLRSSMACFGIATIPLFYIFLRLFFDKISSSLTALALSLSLYHIHYSRLAFMLISVPFTQLLSLIFYILGRRKHNMLYIILSAVFTGLTIYTYNTATVFIATIFLLITIDSGICKKHKIIFLLIFFITISPLIHLMITSPDLYFAHARGVTIYSNEHLPQKGMVNKTKAIVKNGTDNMFNFFNGGYFDAVDTFGKYYTFNSFYISLSFFGIILGLREKRKSCLFFAYSFFFCFFFICTVSAGHGIYRRLIVCLVYLYFFMALAINSILYKLAKSDYKKFLTHIFIIIVFFSSAINIFTYLYKYARDPESYYFIGPGRTEAALYINSISDKSTKILYFSNMDSINYESYRFILYDFIEREDRAKEFAGEKCEITDEIINSVKDKISDEKDLNTLKSVKDKILRKDILTTYLKEKNFNDEKIGMSVIDKSTIKPY